jgi:uncharacterized protein (DUF1501 family)
MAFRMQASIPELADLSKEPESTYALYGDDARNRGSFASSALMARRLVERGVRFVQIFHRGWDQHGTLPRDIASQCKDVDQACYGLVQDLKQRGLLDDTLVVWMGEFGRTPKINGDAGRDHWPGCYSVLMAGGGVRGGQVIGSSDETGAYPKERPVSPADIHASIYTALGYDHRSISYRSSDGRPVALTEGATIHELF